MKYILVRRIESYHQCYWSQSSSIGGAGGSTASKQGSVNSSRSGLILFEFNIHSNLGNKSDQLGSAQYPCYHQCDNSQTSSVGACCGTSVNTTAVSVNNRKTGLFLFEMNCLGRYGNKYSTFGS